MTTQTTAAPTTQYTIEVDSFGTFTVLDNATGAHLLDKYGTIRRFSTRNAARKRISRERSGNFHK